MFEFFSIDLRNRKILEPVAIVNTIPIIIKAWRREKWSVRYPKSGPIIEKKALIIRLLIDSTVALISEDVILFI